EPWVYRLGPGSSPTAMLSPADILAFDVWNGADVLGSDALLTTALDGTPDGGLLIAAGAAIYYAAPEGSAPPPCPITSIRLRPPARVRIRLRLTTPAPLEVTLWEHGRAVARVNAPAQGLSPAVMIDHRVKPGIHRVTVNAWPGGASWPVGSSESSALLARALPIAVTRDLAESQSLLLATY